MKLTREELRDLNNTGRTMFRLETLQHYSVDRYDERLQAFLAGEPLPTSPAKETYLRRVAERIAAGKRMYRAHIVDQPLTDYIRYELAVYAENAAAGEEIYIAERTRNQGLADLTEDFLLVDDAIVVWYRYDASGRLIEHDRSDDPADLARCRQQRDLALAHAVPLADYMARIRAAHQSA